MDFSRSETWTEAKIWRIFSKWSGSRNGKRGRCLPRGIATSEYNKRITRRSSDVSSQGTMVHYISPINTLQSDTESGNISIIIWRIMIFNSDEFHSRDITLSAYLVMRGFKLKRVVREWAKWAFFFEMDPEIDWACERYYTGATLVDPHKLMNTRSYLKTRIFGYKFPEDL